MEDGSSATVIKSGSPKQGGVLKHRILAANAEAKAILDDAEERAGQITKKARTLAANALQSAKEKGQEDALNEYHQHVLDALELRDRVLQETEADLLKLSVRLAEKIIGKELETSAAVVADIVNTALQHARQQHSLAIRVNPGDLRIVQNEIEKFKSTTRAKFIDVSTDPRVSPGGCMIESEVGTVDARLETQFRVLAKALLSKADGDFNNDHE